MLKPREKLGIFVPIDCLLDTRLATLYVTHKELVPKALDANYLGRDEDVFPYVDKETFAKLYAKRDVITLQEALPTRCLGFLKEMVTKLMRSASEEPQEFIPKVIINVYPYKLTNEEVEVLVKTIALKTDKLVDVTAVYMSEEEITPRYCKSNLCCIFQYDASKWLDVHAQSGAFKNCQIPDITLYMPKINHGPRPSDEKLAELKSMDLDPYKAWEISASPIITACFIETETFCIDIDAVNKQTQ